VAYHRGVAVSSAPGNPPQRISWASRLLAPLALVAVLIAIGVIITANTDDGGKSEDTTARVQSDKKDGEGAENPRTYVVEEGDTLSGVAAKFDVSVKRLERLNPDIDPQTLSTGQELTIR
jgi:LysM repeat protein